MGSRDGKSVSGNSVNEAILSMLLTEMDGIGIRASVSASNQHKVSFTDMESNLQTNSFNFRKALVLHKDLSSLELQIVQIKLIQLCFALDASTVLSQSRHRMKQIDSFCYRIPQRRRP